MWAKKKKGYSPFFYFSFPLPVYSIKSVTAAIAMTFSATWTFSSFMSSLKNIISPLLLLSFCAKKCVLFDRHTLLQQQCKTLIYVFFALVWAGIIEGVLLLLLYTTLHQEKYNSFMV